MAIDFPNSPTNGQTYSVGDKMWTYNSADNKWLLSSVSPDSGTLTTKGDLLTRSSSAITRLGVGTNGHSLVADSAETTGLKWAIPSGITVSLASGSLSSSSVVLSSISGSYNDLKLVIKNFKPATNTASFFLRVNADSGSNRYKAAAVGSATFTFDSTGWQISQSQGNTTDNGTIVIELYSYTNTVGYKTGSSFAVTDSGGTNYYVNQTLIYNQTAAITSLTLLPSSGNFTSGSYELFGLR